MKTSTRPTSVYCRCGAQWHGARVRRADAHRLTARCRWVSHLVFRARFMCGCVVCAARRRAAYAPAHPPRERS